MSPTFAGCHGKLSRAYEHLSQLEAEIGRFLNPSPGQIYDVVGHLDPTTGEHVFRLRLFANPPVERWGLLVGDAVHNMRAMLDHLVEALTVLAQGAPYAGTEFPIFAHEFDYPAKVPGLNPAIFPGYRHTKKDGTPAKGGGLYHVRGLRPEHAAVIETCQPYHRTGDVINHPLLLLHKLDILDKHRIVPVLGIASQVGDVRIGRAGESVHIEYFDTSMVQWGAFPLEDGAEIVRIRLGPGTSPDVHVDVVLAATISLAYGVGEEQNIWPLLTEVFVCLVGLLAHFEAAA